MKIGKIKFNIVFIDRLIFVGCFIILTQLISDVLKF